MILPFVGLFIIGPGLRVIVPYVRHGLEMVAETGQIADFPRPDWRYLALFLLPALEYGVAFAITEGLVEIVSAWTMTGAILAGYSGASLGNEVVQAAVAMRKLAGRR